MPHSHEEFWICQGQAPGIPSSSPWMGKERLIYYPGNSALILLAGPVLSSLSITQETKVLLSPFSLCPFGGVALGICIQLIWGQIVHLHLPWDLQGRARTPPA